MAGRTVIAVDHVDWAGAFPVSLPVMRFGNSSQGSQAQLHDTLELGCCRRGSGICLVGGKVYPYQPGDCAFIDSHEIHLIQGNEGDESLWEVIHVQPEALLKEWGGYCPGALRLHHRGGDSFRSVLCCRRYPQVTGVIQDIFLEMEKQGRHYQLVVRSLFEQLLLLLDREFPVENDEFLSHVEHDDVVRVLPAVNYIGRHFRQPLTMPQLAGLCFTSEANFRKMFHRAMGCAPLSYLRHVRLSAAVSMLRHSESPISHIALVCGFPHLSGFNRLIQQRYAMSPKELRKQSRTYGGG